MEPFDKYRLRHPSKVHFFTELSNMNPKQEARAEHVTPHSTTDLLMAFGEGRLVELSLM